MRRPTPLLVTFVFLASAASRTAAAAPVVQTGDASISHDGTAWTVGAAGTSLTLALAPGRDFEIVRLATASNVAWTIGNVPDTTITVGGQALAFGQRAAGFAYVSADAWADGSSLQLDAVFQLPKASLRLTRHYRVTSGSPTFETWTTFASLGGVPSVSNLNAFHIAVPPGTIHWLTGLAGRQRRSDERQRHSPCRKPPSPAAATSRSARRRAPRSSRCPGSRSTARRTSCTPRSCGPVHGRSQPIASASRSRWISACRT